MTSRLFSIIGKEFLLLWRDRAGLLVLFAMPAILVVVITLVQENVLELSGQRPSTVLWRDADQSSLSRALASSLRQANITLLDRSTVDAAELLRDIEQGRHQAGIFVAAGCGERLRQAVRGQLQGANGAMPLTGIALHFDPGLMPGYRVSLEGRAGIAVLAAETSEKVAILGNQLAALWPADGAVSAPAELDRILGGLFQQPMLVLEKTAGTNLLSEIEPVRQNVPAWALFGMFFTAIPLAGSILSERRAGIATRLAGMPVSPLLLLGGRAIAYLGLCCCQFALIAAIGRWLFPGLGLPAFHLSQPGAITVVLLSCALVAGSVGTALGTFCASYQQASTLGATLVVTAAALGGVMVPVAAMPPLMQTISQLSPLAWGVQAFTDILVRNGGLVEVAGQCLRLLGLAALLNGLCWRRLVQ